MACEVLGGKGRAVEDAGLLWHRFPLLGALQNPVFNHKSLSSYPRDRKIPDRDLSMIREGPGMGFPAVLGAAPALGAVTDFWCSFFCNFMIGKCALQPSPSCPSGTCQSLWFIWVFSAKLIKLHVSQKKKKKSVTRGTKSNNCIFPKQPAKVTVSVCIPHKENLVKPSLAYFTAMVGASEEYAVRRNGLRLFYLILWSRSWCWLIRELVGSLSGDTEMCWSNRGWVVGWVLLCDNSGTAGEISGTTELGSGLPDDCSSVALECGIICLFQIHFSASPSPCLVFFLPTLISEGLCKS